MLTAVSAVLLAVCAAVGGSEQEVRPAGHSGVRGLGPLGKRGLAALRVAGMEESKLTPDEMRALARGLDATFARDTLPVVRAFETPAGSGPHLATHVIMDKLDQVWALETFFETAKGKAGKHGDVVDALAGPLEVVEDFVVRRASRAWLDLLVKRRVPLDALGRSEPKRVRHYLLTMEAQGGASGRIFTWKLTPEVSPVERGLSPFATVNGIGLPAASVFRVLAQSKITSKDTLEKLAATRMEQMLNAEIVEQACISEDLMQSEQEVVNAYYEMAGGVHHVEEFRQRHRKRGESDADVEDQLRLFHCRRALIQKHAGIRLPSDEDLAGQYERDKVTYPNLKPLPDIRESYRKRVFDERLEAAWAGVLATLRSGVKVERKMSPAEFTSTPTAPSAQ